MIGFKLNILHCYMYCVTPPTLTNRIKCVNNHTVRFPILKQNDSHLQSNKSVALQSSVDALSASYMSQDNEIPFW